MPKNASNGELRIIAGRWRSRRIHFPSLPGIRPTPDRVRETLFNWLQRPIVGARCLDLFAGSGALGLEALSRGAAHAVFVDKQRPVAKYLEETLQMLGSQDAAVHAVDAWRFLQGPGQPFGVVFLDPPFTEDYLPEILHTLEEGGWLAPGAYIYIEMAARVGDPVLPEGWELAKTGRAGAVGYYLARAGGGLSGGG